MLVDLTNDWLALGTRLALQRGCRKREHDIVNQKHSKEADFDVDLRGVLGELALGVHYDLDMAHVLDCHLHGDGGWDLLWHGFKLDAKTRRFGGHYMLVDWGHYPPTADILVCIEPISDIPGEPCFRLVGWVTRDEFKRRCTLKPFNDDGSAFAVHDDYLNPMAELEPHIMGAMATI